MTTATKNDTHLFEIAGLGVAPYRFCGLTRETYCAALGESVRAGASCDFCGTGIVEACWFESSDGKRFKVGTTCYWKTNTKTTNDPVSRAIREARARSRMKKGIARKIELRNLLDTSAVREALCLKPHPLQWRANRGETLLDWAEWMVDRAGNKGRDEVWKVIKGTL